MGVTRQHQKYIWWACVPTARVKRGWTASTQFHTLGLMMLIKQLSRHLFHRWFQHLSSFKKTGFAPGSRERMVPRMAGSIGYHLALCCSFHRLCSTCERTYLCKEKPLCEQQHPFDLAHASHYREMVGRLFLIIVLEVQLAPLSLPPYLPPSPCFSPALRE